ncbi:hypothetical protein BH20ACT4_BH20ACT4_09550 [soil metagenome]
MAQKDDAAVEPADDEEVEPLQVEPDDDELVDDVIVDPDALIVVAEDEEFAVVADDENTDDAKEEEETEETASARRGKTEEDEEEEDEDMLAPDDVEADLDRILKDRMVTSDEQDEGDDDDIEDATPGERGEDPSRLQPKRSDEQLCGTCFLLVRASAPLCPVGDDNCPIFS